MMGIGCDIVDNRRIKRLLDRYGQSFLDKILTPKEQAACPQAFPERYVAKRFAAKEAVVKALGCGFRSGIWFTDIEIVKNSDGAPSVKLQGKLNEQTKGLAVHVSLSDEKEYSLAFVTVTNLSIAHKC